MTNIIENLDTVQLLNDYPPKKFLKAIKEFKREGVGLEAQGKPVAEIKAHKK